MKRSSTTCERAFWAINLHKRDCFWEEPYPIGRSNVLTRDMINMDQCKLKVEHSNPSSAKAVSMERAHVEGAYNRDEGVNLMMAVSADPAYDMEWHDYWRSDEGGTNLFRLLEFYERILDRLDQDWPGRSFCFTMDNLNIHKNPIFLHLIMSRGHRYLFRAPYWSVDGPMEYVFNTFHVYLLFFFRNIEDIDDLCNKIDVVAVQMGNFIRYFLHVGFPNN